MKLVNIRNDDIADGNPKLTLGLIWTIILHFQVGQAVPGLCGTSGTGGSWGAAPRRQLHPLRVVLVVEERALPCAVQRRMEPVARQA